MAQCVRLTYKAKIVTFVFMSERNTHKMDKPEWLSSGEASALLPSVTRRTVQAWASKGRFPNAIQLPSGQWRIPRKDVEAILGDAGQ